jgi:hypothetical protein
MQPFPHARLLALLEATPAGHARSAAHLLGQQFFYSHLRWWRGILEPSSVPLGVIQDMYLDEIYKGREAFSWRSA